MRKQLFTEMVNYKMALLLLGAVIALPAWAGEKQSMGIDFTVSEDNVPEKSQDYSPFVNQSYPDRVYWGDSHLHTSYSWDAGLVGNTLGPDEAYRFAKGERVIASSGQPVKLVRPLDWLVVADHAKSLGVAVMIERSDPAILKSEVGRATHDFYKKGEIYKAFETWGFNVIVKGENPFTDPALTRTVWEEITEDAENHNNPGEFTAFIGYEWSSSPEGNNLHRVVVMRDDADEANQVLPYPAYDSSDPEDLWKWMAAYEQKTGGQVLAIPHNGKLQEKIYDVACSDDREINANHRCERVVGSTVNIEKAIYTNDIGDALLMAFWEDPDFDANAQVFYYVRVLEIPTPRWTTYDAAFYNVELPKGVSAKQQDRAYTSPIWYTP